MTFSWKKLFSDDSINPILLKDIRQSLHSKSFIPVFFIVLVVNLLIFLPLDGGLRAHTENNYFQIVFMILIFGSILGIGALQPLRQKQDKITGGKQLEELTKLSAGQIVNGKILSLLLMELLYFMPAISMLCIASVRSSTSLFVIFLSSLFFFLVAFAINFISLFVTNVSFFHLEKIVGALLILAVTIFTFSINFIDGAASNSGRVLLIGILPFLGLFIILYSLMYSYHLPVSSNRALVPRLCLLILMSSIYVGCIAAASTGVLTSLNLSADSIITGGLYIGNVMNMLILVPILCERDTPTLRQLVQCPGNNAGRTVWFIFSSGKAPAFFFALLMIGLELLYGLGACYIAQNSIITTSLTYDDIILIMRPIGFMALYCTLAWCGYLFFRKKHPLLNHPLIYLFIVMVLLVVLLIFMKDTPEFLTLIIPCPRQYSYDVNQYCSLCYMAISFVILLTTLKRFIPCYLTPKGNEQ